jgi:hypothetical protein
LCALNSPRKINAGGNCEIRFISSAGDIELPEGDKCCKL